MYELLLVAEQSQILFADVIECLPAVLLEFAQVGSGPLTLAAVVDIVLLVGQRLLVGGDTAALVQDDFVGVDDTVIVCHDLIL